MVTKDVRIFAFLFFFVIFFPSLSQAGAISPDLQAALQFSAPSEEISVIINLSDKADLSVLTREKNKSLRRMMITRQLKNKAGMTQGPLKAFLQGRGPKRMIPLWIINGLATTIPAQIVSEIANFPGVESVELDSVVQVPPVVPAEAEMPEWNIDRVKAPPLWGIGFTGAGTVVANMDTGVDINHIDLQSKWRGGTNSWFNPYSDPANAANCAIPNHCTPCETNATTPCDTDGHGTATMGIMAGGSAGGTAIGIAPDSKWIAIKIFNDANAAANSIIHQGFQWILDLPEDEAPDVVNNSWGLKFPPAGPGVCDLTFQPDMEALKAAGISVVFAAGNSGSGSGTSLSPANNLGSFAVGATDITNTIAAFSSRGPAPVFPLPPASPTGCDGSTFPHVVAPGVNIRVAAPASVNPNRYQNRSGTSFSAPHVAGAMALLFGAFPTLTVSEVESILESTTDPAVGIPLPNNSYGYGLIDTVSAYESAFNTIKGNIPEIAIFPASYSFGETLVTISATTPFAIVNRGVTNLSVTTIALAGDPDFSIQSDTCSGQIIGPLLNCAITVQFLPLTVGSKSATLSVISDDPTTPTLNIPMDGFAWASFPGAISSASAPAVAWNSTLGQFQIAVRALNNLIFVGTAQANGIFNNDWVQLPSGTTSAAPAIAWNPTTNKVQIAVKGNGTNNVFLKSYNADGTGLSVSTVIPANSLSAPAVAWNAATGKLQMAIRTTGNRINVGTVNGDGTGFSGWTQLPAGTTSDAPAIAWNPTTNKIQIALKGNATNNIFVKYMNPNGTGVSPSTQLPSGTTSAAPAIAWNPATERVEIAVKGAATNNIYTGSYAADGTGFSRFIKLQGGVSTVSPAIAISPTLATLNVFAKDATANLVEYVTGY
jgi:subtilisin family serine protease